MTNTEIPDVFGPGLVFSHYDHIALNRHKLGNNKALTVSDEGFKWLLRLGSNQRPKIRKQLKIRA